MLRFYFFSSISFYTFDTSKKINMRISIIIISVINVNVVITYT
jgi:hypothetical protein